MLLVGCDQDTTYILTLILQQRGFRVLHAENGADALAQARQHHPAVLIGVIESLAA